MSRFKAVEYINQAGSAHCRVKCVRLFGAGLSCGSAVTCVQRPPSVTAPM